MIINNLNIGKVKDKVFNISFDVEFNQLTLDVFRYQAGNNIVYKEYLKYLNVDVSSINSIQDIPFLPIQFFKSKKIITKKIKTQKIFSSSGTTGSSQSKHYVADLGVYEDSYLKGFQKSYGKIEDYVVLALLPSYLERTGSSLIYMVEDFIKRSNYSESDFYLHNLDELYSMLLKLKVSNKKVLLIGVSFALLDFIEKFPIDYPELIVMETGGMKGRRKEMIRAELHFLLKKGFGVDKIHSEYGMTELLSQAYSKGNSIFECPNWMKMIIRNAEDPLSYLPDFKVGGVNIIDLANYNSISFIATDDLGKKVGDNKYEILGRFDNSDVRGCNLLI